MATTLNAFYMSIKNRGIEHVKCVNIGRCYLLLSDSEARAVSSLAWLCEYDACYADPCVNLIM